MEAEDVHPVRAGVVREQDRASPARSPRRARRRVGDELRELAFRPGVDAGGLVLGQRADGVNDDTALSDDRCGVAQQVALELHESWEVTGPDAPPQLGAPAEHAQATARRVDQRSIGGRGPERKRPSVGDHRQDPIEPQAVSCRSDEAGAPGMDIAGGDAPVPAHALGDCGRLAAGCGRRVDDRVAGSPTPRASTAPSARVPRVTSTPAARSSPATACTVARSGLTRSATGGGSLATSRLARASARPYWAMSPSTIQSGYESRTASAATLSPPGHGQFGPTRATARSTAFT